MAELITGLEVQSQVPLDLKSVVNTLVELTTLGTNNIKAYKYYAGLQIYCRENNKTYVWKEQIQNQTGLLNTGFTYTTNYLVNGYNYNNKTFNLYLINTGEPANTYSVETVNTTNLTSFISLFKEEITNGLNKIFKFKSIKFNGFNVVNGDTIEVTMPTLDSIGDGTPIKIISSGDKIRTIKSSNNSINIQVLNDSGLDIKVPITNTFLTRDIKEVDCDAAYITANFDNTGLGINERLGWAICNGNNGTKNRMGRTSIGYDPINYPVGTYLVPNIGGNKDAVVVEHSHTSYGFAINQNFTDAGPTDGQGNKDGVLETRNTSTVGVSGTDKNMQPYIVTLIIQKI